MEEIVFKARKIAKGRAEGEALVSLRPIAFYGGVSEETGQVVDKNSDLYGQNLSGKILVFPVGKGSAGGSYHLAKMVRNKTEPRGIINYRADPILAVAAIISEIPMVVLRNADPAETIKTGDRIVLDADRGTVKVRRRG
jgi:predicted aconitase with swiveling domain